MRVMERCGCGATIDVEDKWEGFVRGAIKTWRAEHRHPEPAEQPDEPQPQGDVYASAERAEAHQGPSIGFRIPDANEYFDRTERP